VGAPSLGDGGHGTGGKEATGCRPEGDGKKEEEKETADRPKSNS